MLPKSLIFLLTSLFLFHDLKAQETFRDGKKYVDYVEISFSEEVVITARGQKVAGIEDIQPKYISLLKYLSSIGPVILEKAFPHYIWGDTLKTTWQGKVVRIPEMSQDFILKFPAPVLEEAILDTLRKFPEVKSVTGPVHAVPDRDPNDLGINQWYMHMMELPTDVGHGKSLQVGAIQ